MKFKNTQNELITKKNIGARKFFNSRSTALVATVLFYNEYLQEHFILLGQRGKGTPDVDQKGKWNLPCGYLDWDETAIEGIKRELWEETGLDIDKLMNKKGIEVIYDRDFVQEKPWRVQTAPNYSRQNVSLYYGIEFKGNYFPWVTTLNSDLDEVEDVAWFPINYVLEEMEDEMAFNHYSRISQFIDHIKTK